MWGIISTVFLGLYCLMCYYIGRRGWTTLGRPTNRLYRNLYWAIFGLLVLSFPLARFGEDLLPPAVGLWLTLWGWYTMLTVVYLCLFLIVIDLIRLTDKRFPCLPVSMKEHKRAPLTMLVLTIILVGVTLLYGSWNAKNPIVSHYDITVNKQAGSLKEMKIVMVSDTHYGPIVNAERLNKMVTTINELDPDIVVISGDIVEGNTEGDEAKQLIDTLRRIEAKYGKFAVPGNHDRWVRNDTSNLTGAFRTAGVDLLVDQTLKVVDSFYVIGRNDLSLSRRMEPRKEIGDLIQGTDSSLPLILIDHQPVDLEKAQEKGIDLQLSGHTHRGQIFPSNLITGQIYELDWGLLEKGDYHLIVSSGYGTWGPPLRIGNQPEVVSVTISFN